MVRPDEVQESTTAETYSERKENIKQQAIEKEEKFYKKMNESEEDTGQVPSMGKFVEFWGSIWEYDEKISKQP